MQLSQLGRVESYRLIFPGRVEIEADGEGRAEESMPWGTALINEYFQQKTSAHISDIVAEWVRGAVLDAYGAAAGRQAFGHVLSLWCEELYIYGAQNRLPRYRHELTQTKGMNH